MKGLILKVGRAVNALCRRTHWFNEVLYPDCAKFWYHSTFNLDVVNLGSTSGIHAFCYEGIDIKCANWALSHNPLAGDEAILKNYMSYLNPQGSTVIFSLCPFSALAASYEPSDDRYYTLLYSSSIPAYSKQRQVMAMHKRTSPLKYYPVYEMVRDMGRVAMLPFKSKKVRVLSDAEMKKDAEHWMRGWQLEFGVSTFGGPMSLVNKDAISDAEEILERMCDFCSERNMKPVFVIPPVYHTLGEMFTKEAREQIIAPMASILTSKGVVLNNYMDDPDFANSPELFTNSFFLNRQGAMKFTHKVLAGEGFMKQG